MMKKDQMDHLLTHADKAREYAYAPYSKFRVGCAILLGDGSIVSGANIENAAYAVALCAERSAMATVVCSGKHKDIKALAVMTGAPSPASPCGVCRQFLSEFISLEVPIIFGNEKGESVITDIEGLLPFGFNKSMLNV